MKLTINKMIGVLFFIIGLFWIFIIYQRSIIFLPEIKNPSSMHSVHSVRRIKVEIKQILKENPVIKTKLSSEKREFYIIYFWIIILIELICSFTYLILGFTLMREYMFSHLIMIHTLFLDVLFKILVLFYHNNIAVELQKIFKSKNILISYFIPDSGEKVRGC